MQKELGNFEDAIAVAPKVSLQYWQQCVAQYTGYLKEQLNEGTSQTESAINQGVNQMDEFVDYNILSGNFEAASTILEQSGYSQ